MMAKDGLLVRLRITGGILAAATASAVADLAAAFGNGKFDLSARGNLQIRGVSDAGLAALQNELHALGLLDDDSGAESIRNVIASPLAGLHAGIDMRPLTRDLEMRLAADRSLHALPGKFGFLIDDGTMPSLAGIAADIRFDAMPNGGFAIALGGARRHALPIGSCAPEELVMRAIDIARRVGPLLAQRPDLRRMRDLIAAFGADAMATRCGGTPGVAPDGSETIARDVVGFRTFAGGVACVGLAAPFGRLDAAMLRAAAAFAARSPRGELRLTPWRILLVPDAPADAAGLPGFITDPADARLAIAACVGSEGCARGTTATQTDAARFARDLAGTPRSGLVLHISGCAKGCAKPSPTRFTLVARDGLYDLVQDGRAADVATRHGLDLDGARRAIAEFAS
jgi:precorrin-3B synthase